ncbi:hypothetical protein [Halomonas llamarensis]|uniref:Yip1 domain-containing protein n=1 Tax=Halomonas llamarensis TaxID=2945104 RepID=A0ABT0SSU7_9GAMM|nr:hypothetical protein [Halomonas llamarensis]MCL7930878.1 hypothetical protein [Halomonas llamarensis]
MIKPAISLFFLRKLSFSHFDFPRWQAVAAITLIGLLAGLDPNMRATPPNVPPMPVWQALLLGVILVWVVFLVVLRILRWWMKRGGRWDGQGDLFNLAAASWLVADTLGAGLTALGVPYLWTLPLWLYSLWVGANALSGAIPKASFGYSIGGIVVGLVPAVLAMFAVSIVLGIVMAMLLPGPLGIH